MTEFLFSKNANLHKLTIAKNIRFINYARVKIKITAVSFFLIFYFSVISYGQTDSTQTQSSLLNDLSNEQTGTELLPNKMIFTQRWFWGKKGLMRNFKAFQLSDSEREKELKIRRFMLTTHQVTGFATLCGMVAQGIVGSKLYNGDNNIRDLHESLAAGINICYFTTASLALFSPPKMLDERKGYGSIKVHKWLAVAHMSCMIATNILADQLEAHPNLKPYHRAAAFTAFGTFAAAMFIIKF